MKHGRSSSAVIRTPPPWMMLAMPREETVLPLAQAQYFCMGSWPVDAEKLDYADRRSRTIGIVTFHLNTTPVSFSVAFCTNQVVKQSVQLVHSLSHVLYLPWFYKMKNLYTSLTPCTQNSKHWESFYYSSERFSLIVKNKLIIFTHTPYNFCV